MRKYDQGAVKDGRFKFELYLKEKTVKIFDLRTGKMVQGMEYYNKKQAKAEFKAMVEGVFEVKIHFEYPDGVDQYMECDL